MGNTYFLFFEEHYLQIPGSHYQLSFSQLLRGDYTVSMACVSHSHIKQVALDILKVCGSDIDAAIVANTVL